MLLFPAVKAFKVFLDFFFKVLAFVFPFFKNSAILSVYGVKISLFLLLEIAVSPRVLLLFSAKIII
jgi:hypothetical protein